VFARKTATFQARRAVAALVAVGAFSSRGAILDEALNHVLNVTELFLQGLHLHECALTRWPVLKFTQKTGHLRSQGCDGIRCGGSQVKERQTSMLGSLQREVSSGLLCGGIDLLHAFIERYERDPIGWIFEPRYVENQHFVTALIITCNRTVVTAACLSQTFLEYEATMTLSK